jgi:uridine kinase
MKNNPGMLIGIGGVSRSGKTTLSKKILDLFPERTRAVVNQDNYIHSAFQMPWIEDQLDWEDPDSLDFHRMLYETEWLSRNVEILIVEGLFAFYYPALREKYNRKILVEIDYDTFIKRKLEDNRWGEVPSWYIRHIWDSYLKFGVPGQLEGFLRLDGRSGFDMDLVRKFLMK